MLSKDLCSCSPPGLEHIALQGLRSIALQRTRLTVRLPFSSRIQPLKRTLAIALPYRGSPPSCGLLAIALTAEIPTSRSATDDHQDFEKSDIDDDKASGQ